MCMCLWVCVCVYAHARVCVQTFLMMRETKACLYAARGDFVRTKIDICGKEITPGLDSCKDKERWKRYDLELKWAGRGCKFERARGA